MLLTKEQILGMDDLAYEDVDVMEWGGFVRVRTMTGEERDVFDSEIAEMKGDQVISNLKNYSAKLLSKCVVDDKGKRLFTDKEIDALGKKSAKAISRLVSVARRLNGMTKEVQETLEKK